MGDFTVIEAYNAQHVMYGMCCAVEALPISKRTHSMGECGYYQSMCTCTSTNNSTCKNWATPAHLINMCGCVPGMQASGTPDACWQASVTHPWKSALMYSYCICSLGNNQCKLYLSLLLTGKSPRRSHACKHSTSGTRSTHMHAHTHKCRKWTHIQACESAETGTEACPKSMQECCK